MCDGSDADLAREAAKYLAVFACPKFTQQIQTALADCKNESRRSILAGDASYIQNRANVYADSDAMHGPPASQPASQPAR